ncbi:hypothetical protein HRD68_16700 [Yersinia massiliensis]|uniref:hypothetical protein n=1 Tax=Yersinia massiliensis TaxID=419257 RepID=UPI001561C56D|nr:hypothetical protein [Yersinia massiliensis]QKJ12225.1 hypothetical protein HRD68_16700 [Yersinia massiliensis]
MKELDSFTVEEIEEIISSCQQEIHNTPTSDEMPVSPRILLSLARIALAAKRAEPVTWWTGPEPTLTGELESFHDHETGSHYLPLISLSTTSYAALSREKFIFKVTNFLCTRRQSIAREGETAALIYDMVTTPQLNSPEIPEGWKLVPIELTAEMAQAAREAHEGDSYLSYTIYRAMLAAAPEKPL